MTMSGSALMRVTAGPYTGETGYLDGAAPLTEHEMNNVHPPRMMYFVREELKRRVRVAPEHVEGIQ